MFYFYTSLKIHFSYRMKVWQSRFSPGGILLLHGHVSINHVYICLFTLIDITIALINKIPHIDFFLSYGWTFTSLLNISHAIVV